METTTTTTNHGQSLSFSICVSLNLCFESLRAGKGSREVIESVRTSNTLARIAGNKVCVTWDLLPMIEDLSVRLD